MTLRFKNKKSIALVLSGGGIKAAAFHIGVCLALDEKGFKFVGGLKKDQHEHLDHPLAIKTYVGSSAGSIISTFLAAGYTVEDLVLAFEMGIKKSESPQKSRLKPLTYWDIFALNSPGLLRSLPTSWRMKSLVTGGFEAFLKNGFKLNGLFTTKNLEKYMRVSVLPTNDFKELASELYIVATQLNHSRKAVFGPYKENNWGEVMQLNIAAISDAAAASTALPPVFAPYGIDNMRGEKIYFFDGEIRDTLSTHVAVDSGADLVISSYSIQPYHYSSKMGSLHEYGIPLILNQALYQVVEQKIQRAIKAQEDIRSIYNAIDGYCKQAQISEEHREKLLEIISKRVNYKRDVDYIYIHPNPQDHEMFFVDHFSLNKEILERIVKIGFKSALKVLRKYDI